MGKKKIEVVKLIENQTSRNITFCKRKKGILKKAMELSILCGADVSLIFQDITKDKLVIY